MNRIASNLRLAVSLMLLALAGSGCAVSTAVLPSALGVAPVVVDNRGDGQGDTFWVAHYDDVVDATLRAAAQLSLKLVEEEIEEERARLRFADDLGQQVRLLIERRTATVTLVRFDVSASRYEGLAALLGRQIVDELSDADAFLVDWSNSDPSRPQ